MPHHVLQDCGHDLECLAAMKVLDMSDASREMHFGYVPDGTGGRDDTCAALMSQLTGGATGQFRSGRRPNAISALEQ